MGNTAENVQVNLKLNGLQDFKTFKDLNGAVVAQRNALNKMKLEDPGYNEATKRLRAMVDQQQAWKAEIHNTGKAQKQFFEETKGGFSEIMKIAGGVVLANIFTGLVSGAKQFLTSMVTTFMTFEKFETILTNALGDRSAARMSMTMLSNFAAKTPFALQQLTDSFVKLVNRGFKPTNDELTKMGDLAASQGKEFSMLTEAILDAQTGEFERLKEFGIKASKNGDLVSLSFKGMTKEVKFADEAIRNAILGFGEMEGVAGGMAMLTETVGGQMSNLGDNWDSLLNTLGSKTGGWLYSAVSSVNGYLDWLNQALQTTEQRIAGLAMKDSATSGVKEDFASASPYRREVMKNSRTRLMDETANQLKNVKFNGSPGASMDERVKNINEQRDYLTYKLESVRADMSIFKEVEAMEATQKRQKEADDKKIADANNKEKEKIAKQRIKKEAADRLRAQEQEKKEHQQFLAEILKNEEEVFRSRLTKNDAEVEGVRLKYEKMRDRANGNKDELVMIANQEADELLNVFAKQAEAEVKIQKEITEKTKEEFLKRNKAKTEIEQRIFELSMSGPQKEQAELDKNFEDLVVAAESYGIDSTAIYEAWTDAKIKLDEKHARKQKATEQEKRDFAIDMAQQASDAVFGIMSHNRQAESQAAIEAINKRREQELANSELSESEKKKINDKYDRQVAAEKQRAWKAEQRASIAQAIINGALAVTKVLAQTGVLAPFVIPSIIAGTLAQVAVIMGQKPPQFAKGGLIAQGPSHQEGGISLINNRTGQSVGEIEGGEPVMVLSKETRQNNGRLINELLYNSRFRNGAPVSVNSEAAFGGLSQFRTGGVVAGSQPITVNAQPDLGLLINEIKELKAAVLEEKGRPVDFNYNVFEKYRDRVDKIRNNVNA